MALADRPIRFMWGPGQASPFRIDRLIKLQDALDMTPQVKWPGGHMRAKRPATAGSFASLQRSLRRPESAYELGNRGRDD